MAATPSILSRAPPSLCMLPPTPACQMTPPELRLSLGSPCPPPALPLVLPCPTAQESRPPRGGQAGGGRLPWGPSNLAFFTAGQRGREEIQPESPVGGLGPPPGCRGGGGPQAWPPQPLPPGCKVGESGGIPPAGVNQESPVLGTREGDQAGAGGGHWRGAKDPPKKTAALGQLETSHCNPK